MQKHYFVKAFVLIFCLLLLCGFYSNLHANSTVDCKNSTEDLSKISNQNFPQKTKNGLSVITLSSFLIAFLICLFLVFLLNKTSNQAKAMYHENKRLKTAYASLEKQLLLNQQKLDNAKEENLQLNEKENARNKFFSIIAHDLRNPLSILVLTTEFMIESFEEYSIDEIKQYVETIHKSSKGLSDLLENLLNWAKNQHTMAYSPTSVNICKIAEKSLNLMQASIEKKQITVSNKIPTNMVAFADYNMIETVFRNLLNNAIKFTNPGGAIEFKGKIVNNDKIELAVCDNGVGMHPEIMANIFNPDVLATKLGTDNEKGSGLGLILCKDFIERNEGNIRVESTIGKGSCFYFTLTQDFSINDFYSSI